MGLVFPMALPLVTVVVGAKNQDESNEEIRIFSQSQVALHYQLQREGAVKRLFQDSIVTFSLKDSEHAELAESGMRIK